MKFWRKNIRAQKRSCAFCLHWWEQAEVCTKYAEKPYSSAFAERCEHFEKQYSNITKWDKKKGNENGH